jgi:predicted neutral ceramidase superfamily lipid hydrolase
MKSKSILSLAYLILFLAMFLGFGLAAFAAFRAGDGSHALLPSLNCVLSAFLLANKLIGRQWKLSQ